MKQPKQERNRTMDRQGVPTGDTRPSKPLAGETAHQTGSLPPLSGPAKGEGPPSQDGVRDVRRAKAAFDPVAGPPPDYSGRAKNLPDQEAVHGQHVGRPGEQYVRLRIQVRGDRLTVIDSHLVEGPLSQSTTFHGANAYDVTYQDRLLHAGTVPDLGLQRSFPNPEGPAGQRGHHLASRDVAEFAARVPAHEVTAETVGGIRVRLHRVDEATSAPRLGAAPLAVQFEGRMRPIAEVTGLPDSALPESIAARGGRTATGSAGPGTG
jgi:hypothetical protein